MVGDNNYLLLKACAAGDWRVVRRLAGRVVRRLVKRDAALLNTFMVEATMSGSIKTVRALLAAFPRCKGEGPVILFEGILMPVGVYMLPLSVFSGSARLYTWVLSTAPVEARIPESHLPYLLAYCQRHGHRALCWILSKKISKK
jgi:hypothetical protein